MCLANPWGGLASSKDDHICSYPTDKMTSYYTNPCRIIGISKLYAGDTVRKLGSNGQESG
jgi:hypothetical protein